MVQRVTYRRQNTYNTRSNRFKTVRAPGIVRLKTRR
jgi:ribosomal protein L34E